MPEHNVDTNEIDRFSSLAASWWDPDGEMGALHAINPLRLSFVDRFCNLRGLNVLDIGCGGGILSEALALAGARVTAIDLADASIEVARHHARQQKLDIDYQVISAEGLAAEKPGKYDVITCMEMLEHVPDPSSIIRAISRLATPDADIFFSTLNRNPKSFAMAILGAEYILNLIPRGTHQYARFIKPSELSEWSQQEGLMTRGITGIHYNPVLQTYSLGANVDVNYIMYCKSLR